MNFLNILLLMQNGTAGAGAGADGAQAGNQWSFWIMMILIFVVFYFFMIRPQRKKQKEIEEQRQAMKKGDKVITAGGIYGEIKEVKENYFLLTIDKDVTIRVDKNMVYASAADAQPEQK